MFLLHFYRLYTSIATGAAVYFFLHRAWWLWLLTAIMTRAAWFFTETFILNVRINHALRRHLRPFKDEFGPYGVRIANSAEKDARTRFSLYPVFSNNLKQVKKEVEQLEIMEALFAAGMRPQGDEYLLHDLKLKYGRLRLEKEKKRAT